MRLLDWVIMGLVPAAFLLAAFVVGAAVGSGLNVLIYRLPRGQSPFWPPSSCGACRGRIRWHDNVPILGYLRLRGRCRDCGTRFSPRYMIVELATGLGFAGLLGLEVFANIHRLPILSASHSTLAGDIPLSVWLWYLAHVYLFCLAVVQFCCRIDGFALPAAVALPGLVAGPLVALLCPWPWLDDLAPGSVVGGVLGWLAGVASAWLLRHPVRLLAVGQPDRVCAGDLLFLMTVGGLLGWQAVVITLALALVPSLITTHFRRGPPSGAWLAVAAVVTLIAWPWLGIPLRPRIVDG